MDPLAWVLIAFVTQMLAIRGNSPILNLEV